MNNTYIQLFKRVLATLGHRVSRLVLVALTAASFTQATSARAADPVTDALQRGIVEEESRRNLTNALAAYEEAVRQHSQQREAAATALFRMAEVQRRLGRTNEAAASYRRLALDYPERTNLVGLVERQAGSGVRADIGRSSLARRRVESLEAEITAAEARLRRDKGLLTSVDGPDPASVERRILANHSTPALVELTGRIRATQDALAGLSVDLGPAAPDRKRLTAQLENQQRLLAQEMEAVVLTMREQVVADERQLEALKGEFARARAEAASDDAPASGPTERERLIREEVGLVEKQLAYVRRRVANGTASPEDEIPLQRQILSLQRELLREKRVDLLDVSVVPDPTPPNAIAPAAPAAQSATPTSPEEDGEIARLRALLANSPDLLDAIGEGGTPLERAATRGHLAVARFLIENHADLNRGDPDRGRSPLFLAAAKGHKAIVELLLEKGASTKPAPTTRLTPLHLAVEAGHRAVAETLIKAGYDVNQLLERNTGLGNPLFEGATPLGVAVVRGNRALVELLLSHGANPNLGRGNNYPVLVTAVAQGQLDVVELLLKAGADPNRADSGASAVIAAARHKDLAFLKALFAAGARPGQTNSEGATALAIALPDAIQLLVAQGADPSHTDNSGATALLRILLWEAKRAEAQRTPQFSAPPQISALETRPPGYDSLASIRALLAAKANPNLARSDGLTPLYQAVVLENREIVEALLEAGASPDPEPVGGDWPLQYAVGHNATGIVEALLKHRADPNRLSARDRSRPLLEVAVNGGKADIVRLLLAAGADVKAASPPELNTALHYAAASGRRDLLELLLNAGADPNQRNAASKTPYDFALESARAAGQPMVIGRSYAAGLPPTVAIPGNLAAPGVQPTTTPPIQPVPPSEVVELLRQRGARELVMEPGAIVVSRTSNGARIIAARRSTNGWYQPNLLDVLVQTYDYALSDAFGFGQQRSLDWPDLREIRILRYGTTATNSPRSLPIDVAALLTGSAAIESPALEWGDVIEIPEMDHPLEARWRGFLAEIKRALLRHYTQQVSVVIRGETNRVYLGRVGPAGAAVVSNPGESQTVASLAVSRFWLKHLLTGTGILRASSDPTRIRVRRVGSDATPRELPVNLNTVTAGNDQSDIWLRDGDVIEIPDRSTLGASKPGGRATIFGEIQAVVPWEAGQSVTVASAIAGAPKSPSANLRKVKLHPADGSAPVAVDVEKILKSNDRENDPVLHDGDRIEVPARTLNF